MNDKPKEILWKDDPLWFKDAIIYQLHVKAFNDSNHDGMGDFRGLTQKLNYVQDLGVNTLWLLPFYPSPLRDDGYDISDYRNIHSDYGTRHDFKIFVREAHRRGLKIITELVINHTSDQHSWFQAARRASRGSSKRNFYVWSDSDKKYAGTRIIFTDTETSNWTWDPVAQQYYWHRFFSHQPDLNFDNPNVVKAVLRTMRFWLDAGVDGMRLDAIPYLCEREGTNNENLPETHAVLKQMRAVVDEHYKSRVFLAEANQWPEDVREYFGEGDECHMAYHFPLMPRMYMAIAQEDRHPIVEIMEQTPEIPEACQWAVFLRNHDELTLEMVTDKERDYMYNAYAADPRARINVGIRRRLAPLMNNDGAKMRLMNSLLMSMPGSPIIYYGDEIGMGDNIYLGDRNGVRTPMQWSPDRNAGFSRADPQRLYLPPIMDPIYGYEAVNVEAQSRSPSSLLNWMKRLLAVRKTYKAFSRGNLTFLRPGNRKILAFIRDYEDETIFCVANMSRTAQPVELDLSPFKGRIPLELMGRTPFPPIGELPYLLTLDGHGFYWFRLATEAEVPSWHEERLPPAELPVLVLAEGWKSFFAERVEGGRRALAKKLDTQLERRILPNFLVTQRWFAAKGERIERVEFQERDLWKADEGEWLLTWLQVRCAGIDPQRYFLPLSLAWEKDDEERIRSLGPASMAKVREQANMGVLYDAFSDEGFCRSLVKAMGRNEQVPLAGGCLKFSATTAFAELTGEDPSSLPARRPGAEGSNTAVILGEQLFLKGYRRQQEGLNPEVEMGRFLTEVSSFAHIVPLAGALEYQTADGALYTLALLQGFVRNQGDAWSYNLDYLRRSLEEYQMKSPQERQTLPEDYHAVHLMMMQTLGRRTGEMHVALARESGDPAFDPEPIRPQDLDTWTGNIRNEALQTLDKLEGRRDSLTATAQAIVNHLLGTRDTILERITAHKSMDVQALKTRYHGDYHLGQVLVVHNDFLIIDFEGEPARPLAERRLKHSPLKDVAGMLRSFNYAAYAALYAMTSERPDDFPLLEPFARDWERQTRQAFMAGYEEAVKGCPVYPQDPDTAQRLIDLFGVEKALYELRYELDNRPAWVGVPLGGLLELFG